MKKIFTLLFIALVAMSCEKEEPELAKTTYTLKYAVTPNDKIDEDIVIFEYNDDGEKIGSNSIDVDEVTSKQFTANERATKVKVYLTMSSGSVERNYWVQQVYYLSKNKDILIEITGTTMTGSKEP